MNYLVPVIISMTTLAGAQAEQWVPADCNAAAPAEWVHFEAEMRAAIPSSMIYVPKPFPRNEADILEDLRFEYLRMWGRAKRADVPPEHLPLLEGFKANSLRFQIDQVSNWTPDRCLAPRPMQFYYLVRVYGSNGEELARMALNQTGLWSRTRTAPLEEELRAKWRAGLPTLTEALAAVRARYGLAGTEPQYVTTGSGTVRCAVLDPCIAFKAGGKLHVFDRAPWGGVYEFTAESEGLSLDEILQRARKGPGATADGVDVDRAGLVSVGARWVFARKVQPQAVTDQ